MATPFLRARIALIQAQAAHARAAFTVAQAVGHNMQAFDAISNAHQPVTAALAEVGAYVALDPAARPAAAAELDTTLAAARAAYTVALDAGQQVMTQMGLAHLCNAEAALHIQQAVYASTDVTDANITQNTSILVLSISTLAAAVEMQALSVATKQQSLNVLAVEAEEMPEHAEDVVAL